MKKFQEPIKIPLVQVSSYDDSLLVAMVVMESQRLAVLELGTRALVLTCRTCCIKQQCGNYAHTPVVVGSLRLQGMRRAAMQCLAVWGF